MADFLESTEKGDDVEIMDKTALNRMIEYLKSVGWSDEQIVNIIDYMTRK